MRDDIYIVCALLQDEEIKKLLQQSLKAKKKANKKKKGAGTAIEGAEQTTEA